MQTKDDRIIAELMEQLFETGPEGVAAAFTAMLNLAMRLERERHVGAQAYERTPERRGYANGFKAKRVDTPAGTLTVQVPKSRGGDAPFYPQALERGRRSSRAMMLAIAQMYIQGVSTRDVEKVMAELGLESLSSSQVSRAAALLDAELEAWRNRPLGAFPYLFLDVRYEKVRIDGVVRDAAVLPVIGIDEDGGRSVLGLSVALSEVEVHWRGFLDSLVARGLRGVHSITSDDQAGLVAARKAVFPGAVGSAVSSIWPETPSTTPPPQPPEKPSAASCAPSGTPRTAPAPRPNSPASSRHTPTARRISLHGSNTTSPKASRSCRYQRSIGGA